MNINTCLVVALKRREMNFETHGKVSDRKSNNFAYMTLHLIFKKREHIISSHENNIENAKSAVHIKIIKSKLLKYFEYDIHKLLFVSVNSLYYFVIISRGFSCYRCYLTII